MPYISFSTETAAARCRPSAAVAVRLERERQRAKELDGAQQSRRPLLLEALALLVRTAFILLELGSRPLKNAKKILSCGLICYWLLEYRYKLGSDGADGRGPPQRGSLLANR